MGQRGVCRGVLTDFLEIGEVGFDTAEVGTVGRQEESVVAATAGDSLKGFLFVKGGIVPDEWGVWTQLFAQRVTCV